MAGSYAAQVNPGSFVPTTNILDPAEVYALKIDDNLKEVLVRLYQINNNFANSINTRDAGYYVLQEFVNGQIYFQNPAQTPAAGYIPLSPLTRQVFRLVVNFGALPNTGSKSVAHGLVVTPNFTFTRIYACASDTTDELYIPIPYISADTTKIVELSVNSTNVVITTNYNASAYTITYVILEYLKN
jgi:hypothetical protein